TPALASQVVSPTCQRAEAFPPTQVGWGKPHKKLEGRNSRGVRLFASFCEARKSRKSGLRVAWVLIRTKFTIGGKAGKCQDAFRKKGKRSLAHPTGPCLKAGSLRAD